MSNTVDSRSWLRYLRRRPLADLQLFCFPFAGGGASIFRKWDTKLPGNVEVCVIQLPGREDRFLEPPFRQIGPLVDALRRHMGLVDGVLDALVPDSPAGDWAALASEPQRRIG